MALDRLSDLQALVAVIEQGSLTGAARLLGRSVQSVSRSLVGAERALGVELVRRTTRQSSPTEAGLALYRRLAPAIAEIEAASQEAAGGRERVVGVLRIAGSVAFGPLHVVPVVALFLAEHPDVEVELDLGDDYVDLIAGGYDLAVRIGPMPDSSLKAKMLARLRRVVFAAPAYLARQGTPQHPRDLCDHDCLLRTSSREGASWPFMVDGELTRISVSGRFRSTSAVAVNRAAVLGLGVGSAPLWQVRDQVDSGALQIVLADFEAPGIPIHAVWPATPQLPAKTQLFTEMLAARLRSERL